MLSNAQKQAFNFAWWQGKRAEARSVKHFGIGKVSYMRVRELGAKCPVEQVGAVYNWLVYTENKFTPGAGVGLINSTYWCFGQV